jgi:hypothetical protein
MTKPISRAMAVNAILHRFLHSAHYEVTTGTCFIVCKECGLPIEPEQPIQFDHAHAIIHNGPHEYQNLVPLHVNCHKKKSRRDVAANFKIKRILGETCHGPKRKIPSRPFQKRVAV